MSSLSLGSMRPERNPGNLPSHCFSEPESPSWSAYVLLLSETSYVCFVNGILGVLLHLVGGGEARVSIWSKVKVTKWILVALCHHNMWLKSFPTFTSFLWLGIRVKFILN